MGHEQTIVDAADPADIRAAILKVKSTLGLRIKPGFEVLYRLNKAPGHAISRAKLEEEFGAVDLHFGWFCRRVAELLGANNPDALALVDYGTDEAGGQMLTLKSSVTAAMKG